jgi:quercetin dioxygenase-like cupin family protein
MPDAAQAMPAVVAAADATTLDVLGTPVSVLSDGSRIPLVVGEHIAPPGHGVPRHVHDEDDELFYVLEGELVVSGPQGETTAGAGACVALPRGVPHAYRNASQAPARFLVVLSPGVQGLEMFRHLDRAGRTAALTPQEIEAIAGKYGVRFL